jgi:hypothetical protein
VRRLDSCRLSILSLRSEHVSGRHSSCGGPQCLFNKYHHAHLVKDLIRAVSDERERGPIYWKRLVTEFLQKVAFGLT